MRASLLAAAIALAAGTAVAGDDTAALMAELRRLAPVPGAGLKGRPTKRAARLIRGFNEG